MNISYRAKNNPYTIKINKKNKYGRRQIERKKREAREINRER